MLQTFTHSVLKEPFIEFCFLCHRNAYFGLKPLIDGIHHKFCDLQKQVQQTTRSSQNFSKRLPWTCPSGTESYQSQSHSALTMKEQHENSNSNSNYLSVEKSFSDIEKVCNVKV